MIKCYNCGELSDCDLCYSCQEAAYYEGWEEDND